MLGFRDGWSFGNVNRIGQSRDPELLFLFDVSN